MTEAARLTGTGSDSTPMWVRIGGVLQEVPGGRRHGPANQPPPGGPWTELRIGGRLCGWARDPEHGRAAARQAELLAQQLADEGRTWLIERLGHKLRSSLLALRELTRQSAYGRPVSVEDIHDLALEVGRRAEGLELLAVEPRDEQRAVVLGAVLNLAAPGAQRSVPTQARVTASEPSLLQALSRTYDWLGGAGSCFSATASGDWWRLRLEPASERAPLPVPELGEPLIRFLVETRLGGWFDPEEGGLASIYLPAA